VVNILGYSLVLSSDGNIYELGGTTVFRLAPDGQQTTLYDFTASDPNGSGLSLIQGATGDLLGTSAGGPRCLDPVWVCGVVFRLGLFDVAEAPDLSIRSFKTPRRVAVGATVTLTASTANFGTASATPSDTTFWLSSTGSLAGAQLLAVDAVGAIPAGQSVTHSTTVALPPVAPGRYDFIALADGANVVHETYEANNASRQQLVIGPDLTIREIFPPGPGLSIDPPQPTSTAPTDVSIHTANIGGDVVGPSTTNLYASPRPRLDANAVLLGTIVNVPMKPGEHNQVVVAVTLPAGSYYLVAVADVNGAIEEADEDNNQRALFVTVQ